jgi:hypothetical protein
LISAVDFNLEYFVWPEPMTGPYLSVKRIGDGVQLDRQTRDYNAWFGMDRLPLR